MKNYYNLISGGMTPDHLFAAMTIALLGFAFFKFITAAKRDIKSHRTPAKFSIQFWIKDNWVEALGGLVMTFVFIRFYSEIIHNFYPELEEIIKSNDPMWPYFVLGFAKTWILNAIKKFSAKK